MEVGDVTNMLLDIDTCSRWFPFEVSWLPFPILARMYCWLQGCIPGWI